MQGIRVLKGNRRLYMNCSKKPPGRVKRRRIEKTTICPAYKSRHRMSVQNCRSCVVYWILLCIWISRYGGGVGRSDWQETKSLWQLEGNRASWPCSDIIHLLHSSQRGGRMLFLFTKQHSPSLVLSDLAYIPCVEWWFQQIVNKQLCFFTPARATMTDSSCVGQWVYWGSCAMYVRGYF